MKTHALTENYIVKSSNGKFLVYVNDTGEKIAIEDTVSFKTDLDFILDVSGSIAEKDKRIDNLCYRYV